MFNSAFFPRIRNGYIKIENLVLITLLTSLVALVFMEVVVRAFNQPTRWSVGVAQLIFMWVIFLGANRGLRQNSHIGIDLFTNMLPKKVQKYLEIFNQVVILTFLSALIYYGFQMTFANTGRLITGTSIGYYFITLAIPVGATIMIVTAICKMITLIKDRNNTDIQGEI
ncbi:hypothetical protein CR203_14440 [Salipaludibacillus neizhouensis]|uniref:Tripartite ATP-independent periplasmic transporters DctQ component domain-containing protein n=1 Tax=Salipaludibacillus neizhouensis TaxID=885475 RepID=A0A3A9KP62_9BACI|nr:TRAP transporter small permease [Salipaludibacillus neizhouensis]RKL66496.1 hypothetical protein CR203_14440 [Salipaludibacillus neizhouensis]